MLINSFTNYLLPCFCTESWEITINHQNRIVFRKWLLKKIKWLRVGSFDSMEQILLTASSNGHCYFLLYIMKLKSHSCVRLFVTPWTIQSMEFSRPEYWSGQLFPSPGDLPSPGTEPRSPALQADSFVLLFIYFY